MIHYWICGGFNSFHLTWMTGNYWREELASSNMWIGNDRHTVQPTCIKYHKVTDNWWHSPKKRPMIGLAMVSHLPGMHLPVPTCRTCRSLPLVWWIRHVQCSTISCPTCGFTLTLARRCGTWICHGPVSLRSLFSLNTISRNPLRV